MKANRFKSPMRRKVEVADGKYTFKVLEWKFFGNADVVEELKYDLLEVGADESNIMLIDSEKIEWFYQLQGVIILEDDKRIPYNVNLFPNDSKEIDMVVFMLDCIAKQLQLPVEDELREVEILNACLNKELDLWVNTNKSTKDGVTTEWKNNSFTKPKSVILEEEFN